MVIAALIGFAARAGFGVVYWHDKPLTHDERQYLAIATNIASGRGFVETLPKEPIDNAQQFGRAPLYPLFLAPLTLTSPELRDGRLPADVPVAVKLAQSVIGAIGVWLIGAIALQIAGARAGVAAALIAAVYPPLVWICAYALSEVLYSTLALACVWMLGSVLDDPRAVRGLTAPASPPSAYPPAQQIPGGLAAAHSPRAQGSRKAAGNATWGGGRIPAKNQSPLPAMGRQG